MARWLVGLCILFCCAMPAAASNNLERRCSELADLTFDHLPDAPTKVTVSRYEPARADIVSANEVARALQQMGSPANLEKGTPALCRVQGYVAPTVRFELLLPVSDWNGKFLLSTCDGFCGALNDRYCMPAFLRGYATATTDGGHTGIPGFDAVWAYNNLQGKIDFGYRANHVVAVASKAIVAAFYGREASLSYLTGCSKGGSAGVMAAMRYPGDFDGIIAGAPVLDYQRKVAVHFPWIANAVTDERDRPILSAEKSPAIQTAVMEACDGIDGLKDGLIDDPRKCRFKASSMACPGGKDSKSCLLPHEVSSLEKLYAMPVNSRGEVVYPAAMSPGSEGRWPGWILPTNESVRTLSYQGAEQYLRYMALDPAPGPGFNFRDFNFDTDLDRLATMSPIFDATDPDLSAFKARGGKIILWHGWADAAISADMTIQYFDRMTDVMGGPAATGEFARLFLLPGIFHCGLSATGGNEWDALSALEAWRENGAAPASILISYDLDRDGTYDRTRPVYPYPNITKYKGSGDVNQPDSFLSALP